MYDKYYLSDKQLHIIDSWFSTNNIPLIIYGDTGIGKTSLAKDILKDTILTIIDSLSLKSGVNLYDELNNIIKKNNITLMLNQKTQKRGLIIDDLDIFNRHDKKCFKSIINFITNYNYYNCKIIIIYNTKFVNNRNLSKIKNYCLHLNYNSNIFHKIAKSIINSEGKDFNFEKRNSLLIKSKYNLNIFKSNIQESICDRIDNFDNTNILYKDIILHKYSINDILRIYFNEKITIGLNLLENIIDYIDNIKVIAEIYKNYEIADIIDTQYINYNISEYYIILTIYHIHIQLKKINNTIYYNYLNNKYISQSLIYIYNQKNNMINNHLIYLYLYSIQHNKYKKSILIEINKINKKILNFYIQSFNYYYNTKLKMNNIIKLIK